MSDANELIFLNLEIPYPEETEQDESPAPRGSELRIYEIA